MNKNFNKIIAIVLMMVILLNMFPLNVLASNINNEDDSSEFNGTAIVLLLDLSGSMRGKPFREMKKVASDFVDLVLEGNKNTKIGVILQWENSNAMSFENKTYFSDDSEVIKKT